MKNSTELRTNYLRNLYEAVDAEMKQRYAVLLLRMLVTGEQILPFIRDQDAIDAMNICLDGLEQRFQALNVETRFLTEEQIDAIKAVLAHGFSSAQTLLFKEVKPT